MNIQKVFGHVVFSFFISATALATSGTEGNQVPQLGGIGGQGKTEGAADKADSGSGAASAMGGAQVAAGVALCATEFGIPPGMILIAMGLLSFAQSGDEKSSSGKNYGNASKMDYSQLGKGGGAVGPTTMTPEQAQQLKDLGVTIDPQAGTITKGNTTLKISDVVSKDKLLAAGFKKSDIDAAYAKTGEIGAQIAADLQAGVFDKKKDGSGGAGKGSGSIDGSGGMGGAGASGGYGGGVTTVYDASGMAGGARHPTSADKPSMAGMSKNYNGDPIGVAQDDIFKMMNRRYDAEAKQSKFYGLREAIMP